MNGFGSSPIEIMATQAMLNGLAFLQNFTYSFTWIAGTSTALGAAGTVDSSIQINADADFVVQEMNLVSFTAADTPEVNPDYLLTLVSSGSGKQWSNNPQHVMNYTGCYVGVSNQVPQRLAMPVLLSANSSVTATLQNRSAQAANRVDLMCRGFKVYYMQNPDTGEVGNRTKIFRYRT